MYVVGIKFSAESFSEISLLAKEGKFHLEYLKGNTNVPHYGPCWKNAISDLEIGCKFLSENVQSDLALKFTDCFLQMSGYEPVNCNFQKSACLQKLSDRAFNAYTEFYTHTQSICYFLQSQLWQEQAERTVELLSFTSQEVSQRLKEAEKVQEKLLKHQNESLFLQHDLIDNSKNVASTLQLSQQKINNIMQEFQSSANEQRQLLLEVFENLLSFKSWAVNEMSWFSSTVFFIGAIVISFLFTSVSRTNGARIFIFIVFTLNYLFERFFIPKSLSDSILGSNLVISSETTNSWIWLCRKFCICLSTIIMIYTALNYYDYNLLNYHLLLDIKNQNLKILNYFDLQKNNNCNKLVGSAAKKNNKFNHDFENNVNKWNSYKISLHSSDKTNQSKLQKTLQSNNLFSDMMLNSESLFYSQDMVDHEKNSDLYNLSITSEKLNTSVEPRSKYNLRSYKNENE